MNVTFFLGKPCRNGHGNRRYISTRVCVTCQAIKTAGYRQANLRKHAVIEAARRLADPERTRTIKRASYVRHAEENKRVSAIWRKAHPERVRQWQIKSRRTNPASTIASNARRHARKMHAPGRGVTGSEWRQVVVDSLGLCAYCNDPRPLTMDHIDPLSRGGAHDVDNLAACCLQCNSAKFNTPLLIWLARRAAS